MCPSSCSQSLSWSLLALAVLLTLGIACATWRLATRALHAENARLCKLNRLLLERLSIAEQAHRMSEESYRQLVEVRFNEGATGAPFKRLTGRLPKL